MEQFKVKPHWSIRGVTPINGIEVEVYYHGTLRHYHDEILKVKGKYEPSYTSTSAYINLTRSWHEAITYSSVRNEQFNSQNVPTLLIISPKKVKPVLVQNTGKRLYAHYLEQSMYEILDVDFSCESEWGHSIPSKEWKKKLEKIVINLLEL